MRTPKILVVDDDQPLVYMLKENLEQEGYQVHVGYDGAAALDLTQKWRPDLIVMDINMPMATGIDALTYLRRSSETRSIPVVFITAIESKTLYPVIDRYQRVTYIKKPVDLEHFNSIVKKFLADYPVEHPKTEQVPTKAPYPVFPKQIP